MKKCLDSPLGWLQLTASENHLRKIRFLEQPPDNNLQPESEVLDRATSELSEYFRGQRTSFTLPVKLEGTEFQKSVWNELRNIPFGDTITYLELAQRLGDPNKVRAAGRANGANPIPVIIPCHRVIGSDNRLVGYSGGIGRKQYLLKHEGAILL